MCSWTNWMNSPSLKVFHASVFLFHVVNECKSVLCGGKIKIHCHVQLSTTCLKGLSTKENHKDTAEPLGEAPRPKAYQSLELPPIFDGSIVLSWLTLVLMVVQHANLLTTSLPFSSVHAGFLFFWRVTFWTIMFKDKIVIKNSHNVRIPPPDKRCTQPAKRSDSMQRIIEY